MQSNGIVGGSSCLHEKEEWRIERESREGIEESWEDWKEGMIRWVYVQYFM